MAAGNVDWKNIFSSFTKIIRSAPSNHSEMFSHLPLQRLFYVHAEDKKYSWGGMGESVKREKYCNKHRR